MSTQPNTRQCSSQPLAAGDIGQVVGLRVPGEFVIVARSSCTSRQRGCRIRPIPKRCRQRIKYEEPTLMRSRRKTVACTATNAAESAFLRLKRMFCGGVPVGWLSSSQDGFDSQQRLMHGSIPCRHHKASADLPSGQDEKTGKDGEDSNAFRVFELSSSFPLVFPESSGVPTSLWGRGRLWIPVSLFFRSGDDKKEA